MPHDENMEEAPPVKVMTIVREENLEGMALAGYSAEKCIDSEALGSCEGTVRGDLINTRLQPEPQPDQCKLVTPATSIYNI